jgi:hypothetical protein
MITTMIAKELGVDFGYNYSASAVFKALADATPAYAGLRYPHLKDESNPAQAKYSVTTKKDLAKELTAIRQRIEALPETSEKILEMPKVGHKLHRLTTLTEKNGAVSSAGARQSETGKSAGFAARAV